jgi:hypothetical protein
MLIFNRSHVFKKCVRACDKYMDLLYWYILYEFTTYVYYIILKFRVNVLAHVQAVSEGTTVSILTRDNYHLLFRIMPDKHVVLDINMSNYMDNEEFTIYKHILSQKNHNNIFIIHYPIWSMFTLLSKRIFIKYPPCYNSVYVIDNFVERCCKNAFNSILIFFYV